LSEETYPLVGEELKIIQKEGKYRFGLEAVLLANFIPASKGKKAADLGSGDGVIPLLLAYKKGLRVKGFELQKELVEMASKSARLNDLQERVQFFEQDIATIPQKLSERSFHLVTSNPPFFRRGQGRINPDPGLAIARHELACTLEDVIRAASYLLKEKGDFFLVHRPERLVDIFQCCRREKLEPKLMRMIQPRRGNPPNMVLLQMRQGAKPGLKQLPPLVIYKGDKYSDEVRAIYGEEEN